MTRLLVAAVSSLRAAVPQGGAGGRRGAAQGAL